MRTPRQFAIVAATGVLVSVLAQPPGRAAPPTAPPPGEFARASDLARLEGQVQELRQLLMQLMRVEKDHYDLLLRLSQGERPATAPALSPPVTPASTAPAAEGKGGATAPAVERAPVQTGTLRGRVSFPGGSLRDVYVYVENVKAPRVRGRTVEVVQRDRAFVPDVIAVQLGTKVRFPNHDKVFHNVFSPTPARAFDLGSYRDGEEPKAVEMRVPGVVDVFCNMHASMRASILVAPNALYARVGADGSFEIDHVPVGSRSIVVWGPDSRPVKRTVDLGTSGGEVNVSLEAQPRAVHNNKYGSAYSSYE